MKVNEYTSEIKSKCDLLLSDIELFKTLSPITHKSKISTYLRGPIINLINDYRLSKKLNVTICREYSFYQYASFIVNTTEELVAKQIEVQKEISPDDPRYYENVQRL